jgi:hypothetical protein
MDVFVARTRTSSRRSGGTDYVASLDRVSSLYLVRRKVTVDSDVSEAVLEQNEVSTYIVLVPCEDDVAVRRSDYVRADQGSNVNATVRAVLSHAAFFHPAVSEPREDSRVAK